MKHNNYKLKYSNFNTITKSSYVIISTYLGDFDGSCKLHQEDEDIQSNYFGCQIAEMRAILKFLKLQKLILKNNYSTLENFNNDLIKMNDYNKNSVEARQLRKRMYIIKSQLINKDVQIKNLSNKIYNDISNYRAIKEKFDNKIKNK